MSWGIFDHESSQCHNNRIALDQEKSLLLSKIVRITWALDYSRAAFVAMRLRAATKYFPLLLVIIFIVVRKREKDNIVEKTMQRKKRPLLANDNISRRRSSIHQRDVIAD